MPEVAKGNLSPEARDRPMMILDRLHFFCCPMPFKGSDSARSYESGRRIPICTMLCRGTSGIGEFAGAKGEGVEQRGYRLWNWSRKVSYSGCLWVPAWVAIDQKSPN